MPKSKKRSLEDFKGKEKKDESEESDEEEYEEEQEDEEQIYDDEEEQGDEEEQEDDEDTLEFQTESTNEDDLSDYEFDNVILTSGQIRKALENSLYIETSDEELLSILDFILKNTVKKVIRDVYKLTKKISSMSSSSSLYTIRDEEAIKFDIYQIKWLCEKFESLYILNKNFQNKKSEIALQDKDRALTIYLIQYFNNYFDKRKDYFDSSDPGYFLTYFTHILRYIPDLYMLYCEKFILEIDEEDENIFLLDQESDDSEEDDTEEDDTEEEGEIKKNRIKLI